MEKHREEACGTDKNQGEKHCGEGDDGEEKQIKLETIHCKELKQYNLDAYQVNYEEGKNVSLLSFNFQLNQLLMIINNPILFPHYAYARLFSNDKADTVKETKTGKKAKSQKGGKDGGEND